MRASPSRPRATRHAGASAWACSVLLILLVTGLVYKSKLSYSVPRGHTKPAAGELSLRLGTWVKSELGRREVQTYRFELAAGAYLHLLVRQEGVDLVLAAFDPDGRRLFGVDTLTGDRSDEHLYLYAPTSGVYRVQVRPFAVDTAGGRYAACLVELHRASVAERIHALAERDLATAWEVQDSAREAVPLRAVELYRRAAHAWGQIGKRERQAEALFRLGRLYDDAGLKREAVEQYLAALPLWRSPRSLRERAVLLSYLGAAYRDLGEPGPARARFNEAIELDHRHGLREEEAMALLNLGDLDRQQGRVLEALDSFEGALDRLRGLGYSQAEVTALNEVGALYTSMGQSVRALDFHERALSLLAQHPDPELRASTLNTLGNAHLEANHLEAAEAAYREALKLPQKGALPRSRAVSLAALGRLAQRRGQYEGSLAYFSRAQAMFRARKDRSSEAITLNNLGWLLLETHRPERASGLLRMALGLARELRDPALEAAARFGLAKAERQRGDLQEAQEQVQAAIRLIEWLRRQTLRGDLRASFLAVRQDYYSFLVDLLMERLRRQPRVGFDALAFGVSEQSRARQLLDASAEDHKKIIVGVDPALLERQRSARRQLDELESRRLRRWAEGAKAGELAALGSEARSVLGDYYSAQEQIRRVSPWYASLSLPRPLFLWEVQRNVVDRETLLLEIHLGAPRSYLWVVGPKEMQSFALPDRATLEGAARRVHQLISRSYLPTHTVLVRREAMKLSRSLLGPAAHLLGSKRLVFVVSGAIQYVPWAALPEPSFRGPPLEAPLLVERHEIVSLPSASILPVLRRLAAERKRPKQFLAVLADPVFNRDDERLPPPADPPRSKALASWDIGLPELARLRYSRQEAEGILALAPARSAQLFLGFAANRRLVLSGALRDFRVLHFATHGWIDAQHPDLSSIVLSRFTEDGQPQDGRLRMHEIYELELPADLVVLGSCQTALGREMEGEGLVGLTRGFFYAGARRVLVSLYSVSDQSTSELMRRFYGGLLVSQLSPAAALREAQVSMMKEKRWQAPFHWAGFELQGDWR